MLHPVSEATDLDILLTMPFSSPLRWGYPTNLKKNISKGNKPENFSFLSILVQKS